MEAKLTIYRQIAINALVKWYKYSKLEATQIVINKKYTELEDIIDAESSIIAGAQAISRLLGLKNKDLINTALSKKKVFFDNDQNAVFENIKNLLQQKGYLRKDKQNKLILIALSYIHNKWVKDNAHKFNQQNREHKKYQHLPLELIGFKEATLDLLFLEPLLQAIGIEKIDEKSLKQSYNKLVKKYFKYNNITSFEQVTNLILTGKSFYSMLTPNVNEIKNESEANIVTKQIIEQLGENFFEENELNN